MAFCPLSFVNFFVFRFLFCYKCECEVIPKSACLSMFANIRLLKFVCLSYLNTLPLLLLPCSCSCSLTGLSKLPPPSLKVLLLVDEVEVGQLLPLLVPVQLLHLLLLVDEHHKKMLSNSMKISTPTSLSSAVKNDTMVCLCHCLFIKTLTNINC